MPTPTPPRTNPQPPYQPSDSLRCWLIYLGYIRPAGMPRTIGRDARATGRPHRA